jgi:hypothetical protein
MQNTDVSMRYRIRLVGLGYEPLDFSREDHQNVFLAAAGKWSGGPGLPTIEGFDFQPYGTVYVAA